MLKSTFCSEIIEGRIYNFCFWKFENMKSGKVKKFHDGKKVAILNKDLKRMRKYLGLLREPTKMIKGEERRAAFLRSSFLSSTIMLHKTVDSYTVYRS